MYIARIKMKMREEYENGYYKDRFQALNDGKMLYFNILYRIHRCHSNFELGDESYISRLYHSGHGYTSKKFMKNEEWFFCTKNIKVIF